MFTFVGGDVGDSCEDVCTMGCGTFDAVPVVDTTFSSFMVYIKVLEIVVEIDRAGTEVSTEEGSVGGENGGDIDVTFTAEWDCETSLPFVEMCDNGGG